MQDYHSAPDHARGRTDARRASSRSPGSAEHEALAYFYLLFGSHCGRVGIARQSTATLMETSIRGIGSVATGIPVAG